ncbi:pilus assembly protein TadG-related protein [Pseudahrensia aquimaris]|uniref:Pilus assembly protein TadG-related protein n=1 Tax=Pseudahrensia aquimaris TaxID=744461 RepID=A0ABW3FCE6_9HYPH
MLKKFFKDTSANVALMTGGALLPMLVGVGVAVDASELYRAKQSFQAAVDAAALGAAKTLTRTGDTAKSRSHGEEIFTANIANLPRSQGSVVINTGNGDCSSNGVTATATLRHPMFFDKIHKVFSVQDDPGYANLSTSATVKCGGDTVEIALVLDNSGSMGDDGKLGTLKSAARNMVDTLADTVGQQSVPKPVQFAVIPFAGMVNVGPSNANATWMDKDGIASYHHEHFDWDSNDDVTKSNGIYFDSSGNKITRFSLYNNLGINWQGCVEQRPYPHHTTDEAPSNTQPDTLFVPSFAPDEPDDYSGRREQVRVDVSQTTIYCLRWYNWPYQSYCYEWNDPRWQRANYGYKYWGAYHPVAGYANRWNGDYDSNGVFTGGDSIDNNGPVITEDEYANNYLEDERGRPSSGNNPPKYAPEHTGRQSDQYKRQRWTWKYFNNPTVYDVNDNQSGFPSVAGLQGGPNFYCTTTPLRQLSTQHGQTKAAISAMEAEGATNIQQGIAWGWRALSPGEPLTEGRDYNVADNKKIMVVMTDGNNTYYPYSQFVDDNIVKNPSIYGSHAFNGGDYETPLRKRLFEGFTAIANPSDDFDTYRQVMDAHMLETCNNAKAAGIQIYTIAFDVPEGADVRKTLEACSSRGSQGEPLYYAADDNAELIETFREITEKISELSLTF